MQVIQFRVGVEDWPFITSSSYQHHKCVTVIRVFLLYFKRSELVYAICVSVILEAYCC